METIIKNSNGKATSHKEGKIAKAIEKQTSKLPSDLFLWGAAGAMLASLMLKLAGKEHMSLYIGQLAGPILITGVYNKLVKLQGHDRREKSPA